MVMPGAAVVVMPGAAGTGLRVVVLRVAGVAAGVLVVPAGAALVVLGVVGAAEVPEAGTPVVLGTAVGTAVTAAGAGAGAGARQLRKVLGCRMTAAQREA